METTTIGHTTNTNMYWNIIKNVSPEIKVDLISRLSASLLKEPSYAAENIVDKLYGAWQDDKSAEGLADEIRASRLTGTRDLTLFD